MSGEVPVGTVCPFAGQVAPVSGARNDTWAVMPCSRHEPPKPGELADAPLSHLEAQGWMLCDGRFLLASAYPQLFAVLGTLYGQDGSGTSLSFRIPDYRGLFMRGFDAGAGMDPDAAERSSPEGDHTENVVGSLQCDALQTHAHHYDLVQPSGISQEGQAAGTTTTSRATSAPDSPARVASETRPRNVAVNYIIKFN
jgi:microcystin-dependent protein